MAMIESVISLPAQAWIVEWEAGDGWRHEEHPSRQDADEHFLELCEQVYGGVHLYPADGPSLRGQIRAQLEAEETDR